jgi:hypothetical protein
MTSESSKLENTSKISKRVTKPKRMSQERVMIMFTLYFIVGILLLVVMPEGNPVRGIAMTLYSVAVLWSMFRFGI